MKKSRHKLGHYRLTTGDMGYIIPTGVVEVLPGDVFQHSTSLFVRLSPLAAPVMHPVQVRCHHFYVPHRLVWETAGGTGTWEDFITGGNAGTDAQAVPTITTTGTAKDLLDYYGVPPVSGVEVSGLPFAGYNAIFNEWYRDQDLMTARDWDDLTLAQCAWAKDYFTAARPFAQRGEEVTMPLGDEALIHAKGAVTTGKVVVYSDQESDLRHLRSDTANTYLSSTTTADPDDYIYADLSTASAASVNELRLAFALQRYRELRAQLGARYPEYLATYGIRNPDGRLQIPEYLGGGTANVNFSEVLQTAPEATGRDYGVGDLYGHGVSAMRSNSYRRRFEEWGYVHTLVSVRPVALYMDGIPRTFLRQDKEDFFEPQLEGIGEQAVYKNEVYADSVDGDTVFGYTGRYDDYRSQPSQVTSEFRDTLDYWHLGRTFASDPALNEAFVTCTPSKRVFNEQTQDSLWIMARHNLGALRPVSRKAYTRIL